MVQEVYQGINQTVLFWIDDLLVNYSQKPYKDPWLVYLAIIDYVEKYFYR